MSVRDRRERNELFRRMFGSDLRGLFEPWFDEESLPYRAGFLPAIDVFHDEKAVTIRAEVPGIRKKDVTVTVEDNVLTITGTKEHVESRGYHQVETRCGAFQRTVTLGHAIDAGKITAGLDDGVLTITLPLKPEAAPKQIPIEVA